MSVRTAVVTGATGVIGKEIVRSLVNGGYKVIAPVRDRTKGKALMEELNKSSSKDSTHGSLVLEEVDLTSKESIQSLASRLETSMGQLDVLVNNACASPTKREETKEGIEVQFAVNVLAYHRLTQALRPLLKRAASPDHKARVVNVASGWAGLLDLNDLQFKTRKYDPTDAYQQSKQANRMLSWETARRLAGDNINVTSCYPGWTKSSLTYALGSAEGANDSPADCAATPVWAATSPELEGVTGAWLSHRQIKPCQWAADIETQKKLWDICESM